MEAQTAQPLFLLFGADRYFRRNRFKPIDGFDLEVASGQASDSSELKQLLFYLPHVMIIRRSGTRRIFLDQRSVHRVAN
jgi:hypothetical protein